MKCLVKIAKKKGTKISLIIKYSGLYPRGEMNLSPHKKYSNKNYLYNRYLYLLPI